MSFGIVKNITLTLSLFLILISKGNSQSDRSRSLRIMFYNVENLFDIEDDTLTDDNEFTPSGLRRWNYSRYHAKINSLSKVLLASGESEPPAIVGFCEVEKKKILEDLTFGTSLARFRYDIIHEDSPDERGIDVCLIFRNDLMRLLKYRYFKPESIQSGNFRTRTVLYAEFKNGDDTLHLFINHWPSRRGGVMAGEDLRKEIAGAVRNMTDSILDANDKRAYIIITGDFNAGTDDHVLEILTSGDRRAGRFINLSESLPPGTGTYRYRGSWETIDQFLVSENMISTGLCNFRGSMRVFAPPYLLTDDPVYPGKKPLSTYSGYKYLGGFSDHLPVILDLKMK
jgi:hypothetical protein